jgi:hypothetical protein
MLKHIYHLVHVERRTFSHRDFTSDEVSDQPYYMRHGTFRNKISKLIKEGRVEFAYSSVLAFYTLKGIKFGKHKLMTPMMTPNHMGVSSVTTGTGVTGDSDRTNLSNLPIYKEIQKLPLEKRALHDIHYKFQVAYIWKTLAYVYEIDSSNQGITLPVITSDELNLTITAYHTDTVTVIVKCSNFPVAIITEDIIRLSNILTRVEERLSRIVDECGSSMLDGYETIHIPDHRTWIVTLWHFGTDSFNYKEFAGEGYCVTWQEGQKALIRTYDKRLLTKNKNKVPGNRKEIQERPNKPFKEAIQDKY